MDTAGGGRLIGRKEGRGGGLIKKGERRTDHSYLLSTRINLEVIEAANLLELKIFKVAPLSRFDLGVWKSGAMLKTSKCGY